MCRPIYIPALVSDHYPLYMIAKGKEKMYYKYNNKPINWEPKDVDTHF